MLGLSPFAMSDSRVSKNRKAGHRRWSPGNQPVPGKHTGDTVSPEVRSRVMSRIQGKDTGLELAMAAALLRKRIRMERDYVSIMETSSRARSCRRRRQPACADDLRIPGSRANLSRAAPKWQLKIDGNRKRDRRNFARIRRTGWRVLRIFEHQIERDADSCVARISGRDEEMRGSSPLQLSLVKLRKLEFGDSPSGSCTLSTEDS